MILRLGHCICPKQGQDSKICAIMETKVTSYVNAFLQHQDFVKSSQKLMDSQIVAVWKIVFKKLFQILVYLQLTNI